MRTIKLGTTELTLVDQMIVSGASLVTGIIIARTLGVDALGTFTLGMLGVLLAQNTHHALLTAPIMSLLPALNADERQRVRRQLPTINLLVSALCSVGIAAALMATHWISPEWGFLGTAWAWAVAVFAILSHDFLRRLAFAESRAGHTVLIDCIRFSLQIFILLYLAVTERLTLDATIAVVALSAAVGSLAFVTDLIPGRVVDGSFRKTLREYWIFGRWLLASSLVQWSTSNLFMVIGGAMIGAGAVGALRAAAQFAQPIHVVMIALENRIPVKASEVLKESGFQAMRAYLTGVWKRFSIGIGGAGLLACIFAEPLMVLVYGEEFRTFSGLIYFFVGSALFRFVSTPIIAGLRALERTAVIFRAHISALIFTAVSCVPLLHYGGLNGAGFGMMALVAVLAIHLSIAYQRLESIDHRS